VKQPINPVVELHQKVFESFGPIADGGCDICGATPARLEPRFYYTSCQEHSTLNPFRFKRVITGSEKDPFKT
jgi:hypothetical protein